MPHTNKDPDSPNRTHKSPSIKGVRLVRNQRIATCQWECTRHLGALPTPIYQVI